MLEKYGLKPNDAILAEEKHMGLYEDLIQNHDAKLIAGGAAQNTARGAQYILPANSVLYIGCVGSDHYASLLRDACAQAGLRTEFLTSPANSPTGRCGVIITGPSRSLCTHLAAANDYQLSHLKSPPVWALVQQALVYYVGGYHLTVCPEAAMTLAREAAANDKVYVLSLSAPFIPAFFKQQVDDTSPGISRTSRPSRVRLRSCPWRTSSGSGWLSSRRGRRRRWWRCRGSRTSKPST